MLDNPIWQALSTTQSLLCQGDGLAKRFPADVAPLAAVQSPSAAAFQALASSLTVGGTAALFLDAPFAPSAGWATLHEDELQQMVCAQPQGLGQNPAIRPLTPANVAQMIALAELTEPGPFRQRTIELGNYVGIFCADNLVAMAGERLRPSGFTEVSAVCTHPGYRGNGYARALMSAVMTRILARGETPILHVRSSNVSAIALYQTLGFRTRRGFHLQVMQKTA